MKLKARLKIPRHVKVKNKSEVEVVWVEGFKDSSQLGEYRTAHGVRQIALKRGMSEKQTRVIFLHELLHALEMERGIKIPHESIYKLSEALYYVLFHNEWDLE